MALQLEFGEKPIETVVITPTKEMPQDIFLELHRIAFYMELMERLNDGRVVWDESLEAIYSTELAEAEYNALQEDYFVLPMEIPREALDYLGEPIEN